MWSFAMVNNKQCSEIEVFQLSDLLDREADDFQTLVMYSLYKDIFGKLFTKIRSVALA